MQTTRRHAAFDAVVLHRSFYQLTFEDQVLESFWYIQFLPLALLVWPASVSRQALQKQPDRKTQFDPTSAAGHPEMPVQYRNGPGYRQL